jgi:hypothetical protein
VVMDADAAAEEAGVLSPRVRADEEEPEAAEALGVAIMIRGLVGLVGGGMVAERGVAGVLLRLRAKAGGEGMEGVRGMITTPPPAMGEG